MRPIYRAGVRRILSWAGVGIGAAAAVAYIFVLFGSLTLRWDHRAVSIERGCLVLGSNIYRTWMTPPTPYDAGITFSKRGPGWRWAPDWTVPPPKFAGSSHLYFPLWMPVLLGLFAAYRLLPEGPPRGRCACGYDLTGVRPGPEGTVRCPECGASAGSPRSPA